jgi:hypothetical protein
LLLLLSTTLLGTSKSIAYALSFLAFFVAGLGASFLAPIYFSIAGRLADGKNSLAVAQLSFINILFIFNSKFILAWIVQITSITVALIIAGGLMALLIHFGKIGSKVRI